MKLDVALLLLWLLSSCAPSPHSRQDALMNEVEASVKMPRGAGPLSSYARYYAFAPDGLLVAAYTREVEKQEPGVSCSEMTLDGDLKDVACPALANAKLGERRWVSFEDFPAVADEACGAVQVVYDPKARRILYTECVRPVY